MRVLSSLVAIVAVIQLSALVTFLTCAILNLPQIGQ